MTAQNALGVAGQARRILRLMFGVEMIAGLAIVMTFVGLALLIVLPLERLRPDVRAACDSVFAEFVSATDLVSLERARISLRALDCDLQHRLIHHRTKSGP